jgi:hypothetical protein
VSVCVCVCVCVSLCCLSMCYVWESVCVMDVYVIVCVESGFFVRFDLLTHVHWCVLSPLFHHLLLLLLLLFFISMLH